jgi:guanine nucleotide-binding protein subunit alpha-12
VKLLLLGAGESGKSTFLKQMRIIHGIKFEPDLMREYQNVIYQNVVKGMQVLVDAREKLSIPWEHPSTQLVALQAEVFHSGSGLDGERFRQYSPSIHILWQDRAIKKSYARRREFQLVSTNVCYAI